MHLVSLCPLTLPPFLNPRTLTCATVDHSVSGTNMQLEEKSLPAKPEACFPFDHRTEVCGCSVYPIRPLQGSRLLTLVRGGPSSSHKVQSPQDPKDCDKAKF